MKRLTFINAVEKALEEYERRCALVDHSGRRTFGQVRQDVEDAFEFLSKRCEKGDGVAALTFSSTQAVVLEWATYKLGCTWIAIPWRERKPENIVSILKACRPKLFFLDRIVLNAPDLQFLLKSSELRLRRYGKFRRLEYFGLPPDLQRRKVSFKIGDEPIVRIRFTSGVSGEPKGIIYTQKTQDAILKNISQQVALRENEVMIHGAPIAWASGSLIAPVLCSGGCNVLRPRWITEDFVESVCREQCTLTFLAPRMLSYLVTYSRSHGSKWAKSLHRALLAGGPTPVITMRSAMNLFKKVTFYTTLGMTEASFPITWHEVDEADVQSNRPYIPLEHLTSFYDKSKIDDSQSKRKGRGELLVRGNAVAAGKWIWLNQNGKARRTPIADKFGRAAIRSGDIVERKGKVLHYVCRKDESCLKQNIYLAVDAVEALLRDKDGVMEARIDRIVRTGKRTRVDVTVQSITGSVDKKSLQSFFERRASEANLTQIVLGTIRAGSVEKTTTGKIIHNKLLCPTGFSTD
jgi:acyl-CoA synthetase (AMP-forming)/AMP-acid ligase II